MSAIVIIGGLLIACLAEAIVHSGRRNRSSERKHK